MPQSTLCEECVCFADIQASKIGFESLDDESTNGLRFIEEWFGGLLGARKKLLGDLLSESSRDGKARGEWRDEKCETVIRCIRVGGVEGSKSILLVKSIAAADSKPEESTLDCLFARSSFNASPLPICYKDSEFLYLGCNRAFEEFYQVTEESLIGKSAVDVFGEAGGLDARTDVEAFETGERLSYETVAVKGNYDLCDLQVIKNSFSFNTGNEVRTGLVCTHIDRTDDLRTERQLSQTREILDSTLDIFLLIDWRLMAVTDANRSASLNLGYSKDELMSMNPLQLFPQLSDKHFHGWEKGESKDNEDTKTFNTLVMRKSGEVFDVEMQIKRIGADGKSLCVAVLRDISNRVQAEDELRSANQTLKVVGAIGRTIISAESEMALLKEVCNKIVSTGEVSSAFVVVDHKNSSTVNVVYGNECESLGLKECFSEFDIASDRINEWLTDDVNEEIVLTSKPKMVVEPSGFPRWVLPRNGSMLSIPLIRNGDASGRLILFSRSDSSFKEDDRALYREIVQEIQYAVENLREREAKKEIDLDMAGRLRAEAAISKFSSNLLGYSDFKEGVQKALPILLKVAAADNIFIYENEFKEECPVRGNKICEFIRPGLLRDVTPTLLYEDFPREWIYTLENNEPLELNTPAKGERSTGGFGTGRKSQLLLFPFFSGKRWVGIAGFDLPLNRKNRYESAKQILNVAINLIGELYGRCEADKQMTLLATAINSSDEGVFITDGQGSYFDSKIIFASQGLCRLTGYDENQLIGTSPGVFTGRNSSNEGDQKLMQSIEKNESYVGQSNYCKSTGEMLLVERAVYPIISDGGVCTNYLAIQRDITDKKELESRLAFANKMEAVGQLSAGIAHEINTPSQFIGDNLQFLKNAWDQIGPMLGQISERDDFEEMVEALDLGKMNKRRMGRMLKNVPDAISDATDGAERISTIVKAMREFAHPEKSMTFSDINKSIETTVTVARNEWKYVSYLDTEFDLEIPLIRFQAGDINQVILNLIVNAAQAIADKNRESNEKGRILIKTERIEGYARVSISDTGGGIPEEVRASIFDPFFTTKEVGVGTGQGLFIAHSIVEQKHEGRLWFESEIGEGTTFHLELPLGEEEEECAIC